MNKDGKIRKSFIILFITLALLGFYNAMLFVFNKNYEVSFWTSYGFIMGAVVLFVLSIYISSVGKFAGKVVDISIMTLAFIHLVLEFIMGTIFMCFPTLMFNIVFFPQLFLLTIMIIVYIPAIISKNQFGTRKEKVNGKRVYHYMEREMEDAKTDEPVSPKTIIPAEDDNIAE